MNSNSGSRLARRTLLPEKSGRSNGSRRRGATLVLMAFVLAATVVVAAFVISLAFIELHRTELAIATDAAARAGGRQFAITGDKTLAKSTARDAASRNPVGGVPLSLTDGDFQFGKASRGNLASKYGFATGSTENALQVTGRRVAGGADGGIRVAFPNVFGVSEVNSQYSSISTQIEVDVALVIDRSGSMAYAADEPAVYPPIPKNAESDWDFGDECPPNSRWHDVVAAVSVFTQELANSPANEHVSLATYASSGTTDVSLTDDYNSILEGMDEYTNEFESGGTNIRAGIIEGTNAVAEWGPGREWAAKVVIVMTDGIRTAGGDPVDAARDAADDGVMVFAVTFSDEADQNSMKNVADEGHGKHFHATTGADLIAVFREIAKSLPTLLTK